MFASGHTRCAVIGTDCPLLGPDHAIEAFDALLSTDVVLGPTFDGGYYLVGLRQPSPQIFQGVPWSTSRVLTASVARADDAGLTSRLLTKLSDVDTTADLPALAAALQACWPAPPGHYPRRTHRTLDQLFHREASLHLKAPKQRSRKTL